VAETLVIETIGLHKAYNGVPALRGLDLQVPSGSICGLLGRNGAGKTTTIKLLLGMAMPTSGRALVFGLDPAAAAAGVEIRRRTGFVSDDKDLYDAMSVGGLIRFTAPFFPRWRDDLESRYLGLFELPLDRQVKALSRGMRTKLALLLALCRGAELLLLDEPTSGLDPAVTEQVLQAIVAHAAGERTTVLFSTHQIAEVDQIADRVAIVEGGRTVVAGELDALRERYRRVQLVFAAEAPEAVFDAAGIIAVQRQGRVMRILTSGGAEAVISQAQALALPPVAAEVLPVTLKEIFLETVKGE